jgi:hypothetical protein
MAADANGIHEASALDEVVSGMVIKCSAAFISARAT